MASMAALKTAALASTLWVQAAPGSLLITGMQGSVAVLCHQG